MDRDSSEAVLRRLCLGSSIVGAHWPTGFGLVLARLYRSDSSNVADPIDYNHLILTIETRWHVYTTRPDTFPRDDTDLPCYSLPDSAALIANLANKKIIYAGLGLDYPHLELEFESGEVIFVNGRNEIYESWNIETINMTSQGAWQLIAMPGGETALFAPTDLQQAGDLE